MLKKVVTGLIATSLSTFALTGNWQSAYRLNDLSAVFNAWKSEYNKETATNCLQALVLDKKDSELLVQTIWTCNDDQIPVTLLKALPTCISIRVPKTITDFASKPYIREELGLLILDNVTIITAKKPNGLYCKKLELEAKKKTKELALFICKSK